MKSVHHASTVRHRFSAAAWSYDRHAGVQQESASRLLDLMPAMLDVSTILEIGCGTGVLTRLLRRRWPEAQIDAIDIAEGMIDRAQKAFRSDARIRWISADAMAYRSDHPYALVVSNCAVHWLHPLTEGIRRLAAFLLPGGHLAISVMLDGTLNELHAARLHAAPHKRPLGRLPQTSELDATLADSGFEIIRSYSEERITFCATARDLLRHLHRQGLTGGLVSQSHAPLTRGELTSLEAYYNENYRQPDGTVKATYRVGYYFAQRGS